MKGPRARWPRLLQHPGNERERDPDGDDQAARERTPPDLPPRPVRARVAVAEERDRLWGLWLAVDPKLDAYAARRSTVTPVVVLEPPFLRDSVTAALNAVLAGA